MKILKTVNLKGLGKKYQGKSRDLYIVGDKRIIISTDRISAFDVNLGYVPYKGQVLSQLSEFWFEKTKNIIPNHLLSMPHPNVLIVQNVKLIPIEMVVRGYISGVTNTSIWGSYQKGERLIYGIRFPSGLKKNQKLTKPVITPTTKASAGHDERLTRAQIIEKKIVSEKIYKQMEKAALALFKKGTEICAKAGIILVDTKYEFGLTEEGKLILIDEIHTPDSSRFWIKKTYSERIKNGLEPENFDKEFLRLWFKERGYTGDGKPPRMTRDLIDKVSNRYVSIYQKLTGKKFVPSLKDISASLRRVMKTKNSSHRKKKNGKQNLRIAVLISNKGTGSNLKSYIDAIQNKQLLNTIVALVISDRGGALGLEHAKKAKIPYEVKPFIRPNGGGDKKVQEARKKYTKDLAAFLNHHTIDVVMMAGFMTILSPVFFKLFKGIVLNMHPGYIPDKTTEKPVYPNKDGAIPWNRGKMTEDAVARFLNKPFAVSTLHIATPKTDFGQVLQRGYITVLPSDSVESLYGRLKLEEHRIGIEVLGSQKLRDILKRKSS